MNCERKKSKNIQVWKQKLLLLKVVHRIRIKEGEGDQSQSPN